MLLRRSVIQNRTGTQPGMQHLPVDFEAGVVVRRQEHRFLAFSEFPHHPTDWTVGVDGGPAIEEVDGDLC